MHPNLIPNWLFLRHRHAPSATGDPREDLGALMFRVLAEQNLFPSLARLVDLQPQEERRAKNRALLMAMTPLEWSLPVHENEERLPGQFLNVFDHLPSGGWLGVACSLHSAKSDSTTGFVDCVRRLRFDRELELVSCAINDYALSQEHTAEPWLLLIGRKLGSRGDHDEVHDAA